MHGGSSGSDKYMGPSYKYYQVLLCVQAQALVE